MAGVAHEIELLINCHAVVCMTVCNMQVSTNSAWLACRPTRNGIHVFPWNLASINTSGGFHKIHTA